eukprot:CAMPEP_0178805176 /NCGR_PEP_ID=MMETSP0745-20121128/15553_1 /TAXON_ID=913974 /ORGANISM="Nitzschia punctata, Strain CCMP561" /LENGTH=58 /DNA_ID=CAMNT_0020464685 /DNA_START=9 /DNA_END=185 /DNA_ORIENTATION=-
MMPLVAILPERNGNTSISSSVTNMVETTETLARNLLSNPAVIQRLQSLQKIIFQKENH